METLSCSGSPISWRRYARQTADGRLRIVLGFSAALLVAGTAERARADESPELSPSLRWLETSSAFALRWTPLEIRNPGGLGGSGGLWALLPGGVHHRIGLAGDLGIGLGGTTLALGPGVLRPEFEDSPPRHENGWSVAVQGLLYRTWPGWSPGLPTSTTYVGADISGGYVMYRCWLGAMRPIGDREIADWKLTGGVGIGLP